MGAGEEDGQRTAPGGKKNRNERGENWEPDGLELSSNQLADIWLDGLSGVLFKRKKTSGVGRGPEVWQWVREFQKNISLPLPSPSVYKADELEKPIYLLPCVLGNS